jgi:hypothetical protein
LRDLGAGRADYTRRNRTRGTDLSKPTALAILAFPAGAIGYILTAAVLSGFALPSGVRDAMLMIVPLFVAGLCMMPLLLPLFDRMAKRDLAALRAQQAAEPIDGKRPDRAPHS